MVGSNDHNYYSPLQARMDRLPLSGVHWLIWLLTTLGMVLDSMDLYVVSYAMPLIAKEWNLTSETLGTIASGAMWGMVAGAYLWGILSDRIGRRTSLQWTIGIFSVVTGLCGLAWNVLSLFAGRFAVGLGLGGLIPVDYAVQAEFLPPKYRGRMMAFSLVVWPLGGFLGALIAWTLAPLYGWRVLFLAGAVPALLVFIVRFIVPESPRYLIDKGRESEAAQTVEWMEKKCNVVPAARKDSVVTNETAAAEEVPRVPVTEIFAKKYIFRTFLTSCLWFCHCLPYYGILLWLPTLLVKYYNISQAETLKIMMMLVGIGIIGRFVAMTVLDSWGRKPLMITYASLAGIGVIGYNFAHDTTQLLLIASFAAFFYEGSWSSISPYTAELFPTKIRSTGVGFSSGVGRIAAALAPLFIGFLVDTSLAIVFYTLGGLLILEAVIAGVFAFETKAKALEEISQ